MASLQSAQAGSALGREEAAFVDLVRSFENARSGRQVVIVHLSRLQPQNRRDTQLRTAIASFDGQTRGIGGSMFSLHNGDIAFGFRGAGKDDVEAAIFKLKFLFRDDPLLDGGREEDEPADTFVTWYSVENQFDTLLRVSQRYVQDARAKQDTQSDEAVVVAEESEEPGGDPLTPEILARIETTLASADVSNLMRRQSVCAIIGNAPPQPVFSELFISIADLRQTLLPHVDITSNPWLFQHMTQTLDRRMLSLLVKNDDASVFGDISINLNVNTLLGAEFLKFDDNVKAGMRGTIVLEISLVDIFADIAAFLFARDFAHERGYRLCVDGLGPQTLPFVQREKLGVDLLKLVWSPELARHARGEHGDDFRRRLKRAGETRIILCRCGGTEAIEFGSSLGITLFQGRHIEQLVTEQVRLRSTPGLRR
ncbi:MAG: hypothetical protein WD270_07205 [Acetobacterales bacterium]